MKNEVIAQKSENNEQYVNRKNQFIKLQKDGELKKLRLNENYVDELLKHHWLVDSYIAKYGYVTEDAPENTLKAYSQAIEKHYPILISVQRLDDGEIICFSQKTLSMLTKESGYITNMSLSDIQAIGIGETGEKIPTLSEALECIKGQIPIVIDVLNEGNVGKLEQKLVETLEEYITKYDLVDDVAIMSLNPYTLEWFLNNAPWFPRILRSGKFKVKTFGGFKARKLTKLKIVCK